MAIQDNTAKWRVVDSLKALDVTDVKNSLDISDTGYILDARQGKVLNEKIDATNNKIANIKSKSVIYVENRHLYLGGL